MPFKFLFFRIPYITCRLIFSFHLYVKKKAKHLFTLWRKVSFLKLVKTVITINNASVRPCKLVLYVNKLMPFYDISRKKPSISAPTSILPIFPILLYSTTEVACEQQTHFRSLLLSLCYFSEREKRRPDMHLLFAGYHGVCYSTILTKNSLW